MTEELHGAVLPTPMPPEPRITINGQAMPPSVSATIRVAIESFAFDLTNEGLGTDDHGRAMTAAYLRNIAAIRVSMDPGDKHGQ